MEEERMNGQAQEEAGRIERAVETLEAELSPRIEQLREALGTFNERALRTMRQYPGTCLVCAIGVGFLIGRLASRR